VPHDPPDVTMIQSSQDLRPTTLSIKLLGVAEP